VKVFRLSTILGVLLLGTANAAPYAVQPKDTLYSISKKFSVPLEVLQRINNLNNSTLKVGQILEIPERTHTVIKGDTLFSIAKRYGTTVQALTNLNKLGSSGIGLGTVLLIPWDASFFASNAVKPPVSSAVKPPVLNVQPASPKPPISSVQPAPPVISATPPQSPTVVGQPKPIPAPVPSSSWRATPSTVLPQLPPPERPANTFPTDAGSAKPKVWSLLTSAPLPVLIVPSAEPPIPPVSPPLDSNTDPSFTYTTAPGDTLFGIAKRFGLTVDLLRRSNNLTSDSLRIGQVLNIPQADAPTNTSIRGIAERYLGVNYVYGGSSANGLDCSGFTSIVFKEIGITLPRVSRQQFSEGTPVERNALQEGDLVFFDTTGTGVSHVGIYLSEDEFIHAASNPGRVLKSKLTEKYYATRYLGARRVVRDD
jgi:cell wall-associated NlpC family hydrolase